jgi:hypothetical protein
LSGGESHQVGGFGIFTVRPRKTGTGTAPWSVRR